jgi:hypothetical protein
MDRSRVDGMLRLLDDVKQVNARITSYNTRPGEHSSMMPRLVSPPAIEIPPIDYKAIMDDIQATAIRFDLYYLSPEARRAFANYGMVVRRANGSLYMGKDSSGINDLGISRRWLSVAESEELEAAFAHMIASMGNELKVVTNRPGGKWVVQPPWQSRLWVSE